MVKNTTLIFTFSSLHEGWQDGFSASPAPSFLGGSPVQTSTILYPRHWLYRDNVTDFNVQLNLSTQTQTQTHAHTHTHTRILHKCDRCGGIGYTLPRKSMLWGNQNTSFRYCRPSQVQWSLPSRTCIWHHVYNWYLTLCIQLVSDIMYTASIWHYVYS